MSKTSTQSQKETCEVTTKTGCRNQSSKNKLQLSATCGTDDASNDGQCAVQICCQEIRERAYYKWENAGYPSGDGVDFWLDAEAELKCEKEKS